MTLLEQTRILNIAYARAYCAIMPKPYRRPLRWTVDWFGLFGLPLAAGFAMLLPVAEWALRHDR